MDKKQVNSFVRDERSLNFGSPSLFVEKHNKQPNSSVEETKKWREDIYKFKFFPESKKNHLNAIIKAIIDKHEDRVMMMKVVNNLGTNLNYCIPSGHNALNTAIGMNDMIATGFLIENKWADVDCSLNKNKYTAVHYIGFSSNQHIIKYVLSKTKNINAQGVDGMTGLYIAVSQNNPDTVKQFLSMGADPSIPSQFGVTPLHLLLEQLIHEMRSDTKTNEEINKFCSNCLLILDSLLDKLVGISSKELYKIVELSGCHSGRILTRLSDCNIRYDREAVMTILIKFPDAINTPLSYNNEKNTMLSLLIGSSLSDTDSREIKADSDDLCMIFARMPSLNVIHTDIYGKTYMHLACVKGNKDLAKILYERNPKILQMKCVNGRTPIDFLLMGNANESAIIKMLHFIVKRGCDINKKKGMNALPIILGINTQKIPIIKAMIELGADIKKQVNIKKYANSYMNGDIIGFACQVGNTDVINFLLDNGVCINSVLTSIKYKNNKIKVMIPTPLLIAIKYRKKKVLSYLMSNKFFYDFVNTPLGLEWEAEYSDNSTVHSPSLHSHERNEGHTLDLNRLRGTVMKKYLFDKIVRNGIFDSDIISLFSNKTTIENPPKLVVWFNNYLNDCLYYHKYNPELSSIMMLQLSKILFIISHLDDDDFDYQEELFLCYNQVRLIDNYDSIILDFINIFCTSVEYWNIAHIHNILSVIEQLTDEPHKLENREYIRVIFSTYLKNNELSSKKSVIALFIMHIDSLLLIRYHNNHFSICHSILHQLIYKAIIPKDIMQSIINKMNENYNKKSNKITSDNISFLSEIYKLLKTNETNESSEINKSFELFEPSASSELSELSESSELSETTESEESNDINETDNSLNLSEGNSHYSPRIKKCKHIKKILFNLRYPSKLPHYDRMYKCITDDPYVYDVSDALNVSNLSNSKIIIKHDNQMCMVVYSFGSLYKNNMKKYELVRRVNEYQNPNNILFERFSYYSQNIGSDGKMDKYHIFPFGLDSILGICGLNIWGNSDEKSPIDSFRCFSKKNNYNFEVYFVAEYYCLTGEKIDKKIGLLEYYINAYTNTLYHRMFRKYSKLSPELKAKVDSFRKSTQK